MNRLSSSLLRLLAVAIAIFSTAFVQAAPPRDWSAMSSAAARAEMANLIPEGQRARFEAKAAQVMTFGEAAPVYRFYNTATRTHFYTISEAEKQYVVENLPSMSSRTCRPTSSRARRTGAIRSAPPAARRSTVSTTP
jgi:hypothetical protein